MDYLLGRVSKSCSDITNGNRRGRRRNDRRHLIYSEITFEVGSGTGGAGGA